jgi:hypothetical protein
VRCRPLILTCIDAVASFSSLAAGRASAGSPRVASVPSSTSAVITTAQNATTTTRTGPPACALALAGCMRSGGIPNWSDSKGDGFFERSKPQPLRLRMARVGALEAGPCNIPQTRPRAYAFTPADRVAHGEGATCACRHGLLDFPDPTFENDSVQLAIPSSISADSSQFRSAKTTCRKLIPVPPRDSGRSPRSVSGPYDSRMK